MLVCARAHRSALVQGEYDAAAPLLSEAIRKAPQHPDAYTTLGMIYEAKAAAAAAAAAAAPSPASTSPPSPSASWASSSAPAEHRRRSARALWRERDLHGQRALSLLTVAAELDPKSVVAWRHVHEVAAGIVADLGRQEDDGDEDEEDEKEDEKANEEMGEEVEGEAGAASSLLALAAGPGAADYAAPADPSAAVAAAPAAATGVAQSVARGVARGVALGDALLATERALRRLCHLQPDDIEVGRRAAERFLEHAMRCVSLSRGALSLISHISLIPLWSLSLAHDHITTASLAGAALHPPLLIAIAAGGGVRAVPFTARLPDSRGGGLRKSGGGRGPGEGAQAPRGGK